MESVSVFNALIFYTQLLALWNGLWNININASFPEGSWKLRRITSERTSIKCTDKDRLDYVCFYVKNPRSFPESSHPDHGHGCLRFPKDSKTVKIVSARSLLKDYVLEPVFFPLKKMPPSSL